MADNVDIKDATDTTQTLATKQVSSVHYPYTTQLGKAVSTTLTRPADTTAYTAKDAVTNSTSAPTPLTFSSCARFNGGTVKLLSAVFESTAAPAATPPNFDLLLFDISPTATNDNAAFAPSDADMDNCLAVIAFVGQYPFYTDGSNNWLSHWQAPNAGVLIKCASADTALYGLLRIGNSYTPISAELFTITLNMIPE